MSSVQDQLRNLVKNSEKFKKMSAQLGTSNDTVAFRKNLTNQRNNCQKLVQKLQPEMAKLNAKADSQSKQLVKEYQQIVDQLTVAYRDSLASERELMVQSNTPGSFDDSSTSSLRLQAYDPNDPVLLQERQSEMNDLEAQIGQLADIAGDINTIVASNQQDVESINTAASEADDSSTSAVSDMSKSEYYANLVRKKKVTLFICCLVFWGLIGLLIGLTVDGNTKKSGN